MLRLSERWPDLTEVLQAEEISKTLKLMLAFILGLCLLGVLGVWLAADPSWQAVLQASLPAALVSLLAVWLLERKKVLSAVYLIILGQGIVLALAAWLGAGVKGVAYAALILPVLITALFLGQRAGFLAALASALFGFALLVAGRMGWLIHFDRPVSDVFVWLAKAALFFVIAYLIGISVSQVERALRKAHAEIAERTQAEIEIQRLNSRLEQRIAERTAQLAESERRFRILVEQLPAIIYMDEVEPHAGTLYISPQFETMTGYQSGEEQRSKYEVWFNNIHPEDRFEVMENYKRCLENGEPLKSEYRFIAQDGRLVWFQDRAIRLDDAEGRPEYVLGVMIDITERKQSEYRLKQQADYLSTLYQLGQKMAALDDLDEIYRSVQSAVEQLMPTEAFYIALTDYENSQVEYAFLVDLGQRYPAERAPLSDSSLTAWVLKTGQPLFFVDNTDEVVQSFDRKWYGTKRDTRSVMVAPLKLGGKIIGVISAQHYEPNMYTDEHVQIFATLANQVAVAVENARLLQSLRLQAAALNAAANAVVIIDTNGIIQWANPAFSVMTGYSLQEAVGQKTSLLRSGVQGQAFYQELRDTLIAGKIWQGEVTNRRKDGSLYTEEQVNTPVRDEQGQIYRYISIRQDVTQRKQAEEHEIRRREMMEKVIDLGKAVTRISDLQTCMREIHRSVQIGLEFDRVGLFRYDANTRTLRGVFGTNLEGEIEDTSWFVQSVDASVGWQKAISNPRGINILQHYMEETPVANPEMFDVQQHVTLAAWVGDKPVAVIAADNLLTQRPFTDEQLEALQLFAGYAGLAIENAHWNAQLEEHVIERTRQLEDANLELESLAYTIAHDLRIPARAMHGFASILIETESEHLDPESLRRLEHIRGSAKQMGQLVDDLLEFMRVGRTPLAYQTVEMDHLVKSVWDEAEREAAGRALRIEVQDLPPCQGDRNLLKQVWANLLDNAIKFTGSRPTAEIEIGAQQVEGQVRYFIRDNGVGFDMKFVGNLFGAFQRLHHVDEFEGTGMGLAIVQRIVQRHAGRIWAEAAKDQGATFYFTIGSAGYS